MARGINFKGLIIGIIAVFMTLMVAMWIIAVRVDPQMIRTSESPPKATRPKPPPTTPPATPKRPGP